MRYVQAAALAFLVILFHPGCSIALKYGAQSFQDDVVDDFVGGPSDDVWEFEVGVQEFLDRRIDVAVALNVLDAGGTDFQDLRATSRYNFRHDRRLRPYVGGGFGWYEWKSDIVVVLPPIVCDPRFDAFACEREGSETLSSGFFGHGVVGLSTRISNGVSFVAEDRFDFAKKDGPIDFGSNQITAGFRFRVSGR